MLFGMLSLAVIVMRESRIAYYQPGFKSPLYPWVHIAGMIIPGWLIVEMGWMAILFTAGLLAVGVAWFMFYARHRVDRGGAILHVFERLGRRVWRGLDDELRTIMAEKGLAEEDPLEELVAHADIIDLDDDEVRFEDAVHLATLALARKDIGIDPDAMAERIIEQARQGMIPHTHHAMLPHLLDEQITESRLVLLRAAQGIATPYVDEELYAMLLLIGPDHEPTQHLRILAHLGNRIEDSDFMDLLLSSRTEIQLKEALLREERIYHLWIRESAQSGHLVGLPIREAGFPSGALVALVQRANGALLIPEANTRLKEGDRLTLIGNPDALTDITHRYGTAYLPATQPG